MFWRGVYGWAFKDTCRPPVFSLLNFALRPESRAISLVWFLVSQYLPSSIHTHWLSLTALHNWAVLHSVCLPSGIVVKSLPANAGDKGDAGSIPGSGRSPGGGNGNLLQYSCLENSMDRGPWWAIVQGVAESCTELSMRAYHTHTHTHTLQFYHHLSQAPQSHKILFSLSSQVPYSSETTAGMWILVDQWKQGSTLPPV